MTKYVVRDKYGEIHNVSLIFDNLKVGDTIKCTYRGVLQPLIILEVINNE